MDYLKKIIGDIEVHSVEGISACLANGVNPNVHFNNAPLFNELTSAYARTSRFKECVRSFVDHGLIFEDKALLLVLLDDAPSLEIHLADNPELIHKHYFLRSAYTPLEEATLMHICAEFNHVSCAEVLFRYGADVNARAGTCKNGFGGQTPVFHTVNQNSNNSLNMLDFLLSKNADLHLTVKGIIWGKGYPWETFCAAVNPISYAMMGLLPQMHRSEISIANVISKLLKAAYDIEYVLPNIPNKYLNS